MTNLCNWLIACLLALALLSVGAQSAEYTVKAVGTLGGSVSSATAINNSSQVVGWASTTSGEEHAFIYSDGTTLDIGFPNGTTSYAWGINNSGQAIGYDTVPGGQPHAFVYSSGTPHDIPAVSGTTSYGYAINDSGQTAGTVQVNSPGQQHAFRITTGSVQDLQTLGGLSSSANGMNSQGDVVGLSLTTAGSQHAFLYQGGTMQDLGTLPDGGNSEAYAINDHGQIVGYSELDSTKTQHAFLYDGETMQDLGTLADTGNSRAYAINSQGQVVGSSDGGGAFLYHDGTMDYLNDLIDPSSGWVLGTARGINDFGQIVGFGTLNGAYRGFLLTPAIDGDANGDSMVNGLDVALAASNWLASGDNVPGDVNDDGVVNGLDLALMASNWLHTFRDQPNAASSVPEPSSWLLALLALAGVCAPLAKKATLASCKSGRFLSLF